MQGSPHRPFVPRVTPTKGQAAIESSDFAVTRPFVPGADRERVDSLNREYKSSARPAARMSLPSIEAFLDVAVPRATGHTISLTDDFNATPLSPEEEELPPVEHFVDPLPSVSDYSTELNADAETGDSLSFTETIASETATSDGGEWGETDWQQFDWRSAAALGETGDSEATNAWAATDWDASAPQDRERRPTAAQALAIALDEIAKKIRDGELALPISGMPSDPGSIAASLAALLGVKR